MHYDVKVKLNKIDSDQHRGIKVPEIDWSLNEAQEIIAKKYLKPKIRNGLGFETSQLVTDSMYVLAEENIPLLLEKESVSLPGDYWYFVRAFATIHKKGCGDVKARFYPKQHDDEFEKSPFDRSSFQWRVVNGTFYEGGIKLYPSDFTVKEFHLDYIRKLRYIHAAKNFADGSYKLPSGVVLTGSVDCELPEHTHREIVDIAVLILTGQLESPNYELKMAKLNLNNLN